MSAKPLAAIPSGQHCGPALLIGMVVIVAVVLLALVALRSEHREAVAPAHATQPTTNKLANKLPAH